MSSINLDNPWLLFIALPLVALFVIPFAIAIRKDNINGHNIASGVIHVIMALIIAFVAAGTSIVTTVTQTDVYVLADVSYSASKNLDTVDGYVRELSHHLPDNSRMGVICFGKDTEIVTHLGSRFSTVKNSSVDDSATDIVGALDFAESLFRENVIKRIVLITDGKQTNESDANALKRKVDALTENNIHVDAIYLNDNIKADAREVQISGVQYTQTVCTGRGKSAELAVNCSCPETQYVNGALEAYEVEANFTVYKNGADTPVAVIPARLTRGTNRVNINLDTEEAGTYEYRVVVAAEEDENRLNNEITFSQTVTDNFKVLLITNSTADRDAVTAVYSAAYGENEYDESGNLVKGVKSFSYVGDREIPYTVEELCLYDEIVLYNVNATQIQNSRSFLTSLDTAVSLFGKSLVTLGNTYIQMYPAGDLKTLSDMLPVVYGKSDADPKLYTLMVDTSRSMERYDKLSHAKEAATQLVSSLSDSDMVALIEFNGDSYIRYNPVPVSASRSNVIEYIQGFGVNQGTVIGSAFDAAYTFMQSGQYSEKRCVLFTDGVDFADTNLTALKKTVEDMLKDDIATSVFDVGRWEEDGGGNLTLNNVRKAALQEIGDVIGKGGYYDISNDANLQDVVLNKLPESDKKGGQSFITVKRRGDEVLAGISNGTGGANLLDRNTVLGFHYSQLKSSATNVLTVKDYVNQNSNRNKDIPLYSYWNYGNGRVACYTSEIYGNWAGGINSEVRQTLFANVLKTNMPEEKSEYPFVLDITEEEGYANIVLTPARVNADVKTAVQIQTPDGGTVNGSMAFGSSSFDYTFVTSETGTYKISISYEYGGRTFVAERTLSMAYSAEYDSFAMYDPSVLHKAISSGGIVSEDGKLEIVNDEKEVGLYNLSLNIPLLIICVVLYAVDIAVRKLKWEDIKSLFNMGKRVKK